MLTSWLKEPSQSTTSASLMFDKAQTVVQYLKHKKIILKIFSGALLILMKTCSEDKYMV